MEKKQEEAESLVLTLPKPVVFEGTEYREIDLSGLENLTAQDMIDSDKFAQKAGTLTLVPATGAEFAIFMASRATGMPIEFFRLLPARAVVRLQNLVTNFFYGET